MNMELSPTSHIEPDLWALARSYYLKAEAYDRIVCTGPVVRDEVQPSNSRELGLINTHARTLRTEIASHARALGYQASELRDALRTYERSSECRRDLQELSAKPLRNNP